MIKTPLTRNNVRNMSEYMHQCDILIEISDLIKQVSNQKTKKDLYDGLAEQLDNHNWDAVEEAMVYIKGIIANEAKIREIERNLQL